MANAVFSLPVFMERIANLTGMYANTKTANVNMRGISAVFPLKKNKSRYAKYATASAASHLEAKRLKSSEELFFTAKYTDPWAREKTTQRTAAPAASAATIPTTSDTSTGSTAPTE